MRSLFIVGGTGQIGRAAALKFKEHGWRVMVGHRGVQPLPETLRNADVGEAIFDRDEAGSMERALGSGADVLLDCAAYTVEHGRQLVEVSSAVGAIVAISSASVYRDEAGRTLDEARQNGFPDFPVPIPETSRTVAAGPETYSTKKVALEQALLDGARSSAIVLRPGAVHGPGSMHPREWWFIKRALDGRSRIPVSYEGLSLFHTTATANLAEACRIGAERGGRHVLNIGDPEPPTVARIATAIGSAMGRPLRIASFPGPPRGTVGATPWSIPSPIMIETRAIEALGYRPVVSYAAAIAATLTDLIEVAERAGDWRRAFPALARYPYDLFDYDAEDAFLSVEQTSIGGSKR